jgi:tetratricopeptide (TPR) repeat protein
MKRSVLKCVGSVLVLLALVTAGCANSPKKLEGQILYEKGELGSAIDACTKAIQANADNSVAYFYRAHAYMDKGDYDKAIADYTEVLRLDQSVRGQTTYYYRGKAYLANGGIDMAISDFTESINSFTGTLRMFDAGNNFVIFNAYWERGFAYFKNREYDRAIDDFNQAIEIPITSEYTFLSHSYRGDIYAERRDYDRAIADYNEAIRLDPGFADPYNSRGMAHYYKGDYDRAIADFTEALRINPNFESAKNNLEIANGRGR